MISNAVYLLVGCSSPSTVTLIANNTAVSATSWTINVTLPAIDETRYLNVLSEKGNDGVVNVLLPTYIDSSSNNLFTGYSVSLHSNGSFNAYGLKSLLLNVDHIAVTSREPIFATVTGAPSNAEMVVNALTGSSLDVQQLTSPLLAVNLQAKLSSSVLLGPMTYVAHGPGSFTHLNCTFAEQVSFDGCLLLNTTTSRTTSAWFKAQLDIFDIPHSNAEHVFCAFDTEQVTISSQTVNAIIPSFEPPARVLTIDSGNLNLRDAIQWTNASIVATHLRVEPRYRVELDDRFKAAVDIHFVQGAVMSVTCNKTHEEYARWTVCTNQPSFDWFGPSCFGSIGTFEIPNLNFTGTGMTIANMNLSALREVANNNLVTITDRIFTLDNETHVKFNEDAPNMSWSVHMSTLNHSIVLVDSAPWCQLVVSGTASTLVTSVTQHHVVFPGRDLVYHWETKLLEPFDLSNDSTCLRPNEMCSPNFWIDIQAHGTYLCEPKCSSFGLTINTTLAVECYVPLFSEGWSVLIAAREYVPAGPNIPIILFALLYFSLIALTALSNAFDGLMLFGGWAECVITGALFTVNSIENYWNLDIRSLIVSANEIIDGMFESWLCDDNMAFEVPAWALLACAAVVLLVSSLQLLHDAGNNIYVRIAKSLSTASLLVFLPYFITRVGMPSWPEMFPIGVIAGRFIFDAFYPAVPWSRTMILKNFENSPAGDEFTLRERLMNGAVNLALPVICVVASTLTREDVTIEPMTATWILFAMVLVACGASVLRVILFTSSAPRLMHQQLALPAQIIAFVMIGLSTGAGLTLVALLHYLPTLPATAFVTLWCGWVVLLALVPVLFVWRKIEKPQPKSQRNSEYVLLDEFDNSVVTFHNKL